MMSFINSLLSGDEKEVDSVIACGVVALISLIGFCAYQAVTHPELFSAGTYAGGAASLVASIGGSKRFRDGPINPPPQGDK